MINQSCYNWFVIPGVEGVLSSGLVPTLVERVLVEDDISLKVSILLNLISHNVSISNKLNDGLKIDITKLLMIF